MVPEFKQIQMGMLSLYLLNVAEADPSNPDNDFAPELHERMYAKRTREMWMAAGFAANAGLAVGIAIDPEQPDWPVLYIELGDGIGQVSWHVPAHPVPFDGHDTAEKYKRIGDFAELHDLAPTRPLVAIQADTPSEAVDSSESA